uniref:Uncharacterized protein n=1 Tax=viral metagenome TaxID=1070528 RepID=A0A6H1ZYD7_9ZZZZ
MHSLLQRLFKKRGIESVDQLDDDEKVNFNAWNAILSKEELTIKDIEKFCQSQVDLIENKWKDYNVLNNKKAECIPYHTVYKTLLMAINSPRSAREQCERQLLDLLNK